MNAPSQQQILTDVIELVRNFPGREYSGHIGRETLFFGELGFVSIDAVVLGEMLEEHFGQKLPYARFLQDLSAQNAQDLEVGQLVDFLEANVR